MSKQKLNKTGLRGFTIIEIILVLAVVGLILLVVFVVLPTLQRSQHDTTRRDDMSRVGTALVKYQTDHSLEKISLPNPGATASIWTATEDFGDECSEETSLSCLFVRDYINSDASETGKKNDFRDPDESLYNIVIAPNWGATDQYPDGIEYNENSKLIISEGGQDGKVKGNAYTIGGNSPLTEHVIYIMPGAKCNGGSAVKAERRHFAILYYLEDNSVYCLDNK